MKAYLNTKGSYPSASFAGNTVTRTQKGSYFVTVTSPVFPKEGKMFNVGFDGQTLFKLEKGRPQYEDESLLATLRMTYASFRSSTMCMELVAQLDAVVDGASADTDSKASDAVSNTAQTPVGA